MIKSLIKISIYSLLIIISLGCKSEHKTETGVIEKASKIKQDQESKIDPQQEQETIEKYVTAVSGLNYRKEPKGEISGKFKFGEKVKVVSQSSIFESIEDKNGMIEGEWLGVEVNSTVFYTFGGYLSSKADFDLLQKKIQRNSKPAEVAFTERLKNKQPLSSLLSNPWTFIYHADNRCTGSTDGKITFNQKNLIDNIIEIEVLNDSQYAWACEKRDPYSSKITFNLKEKLKEWDRIELQFDEYSNAPEKEGNTFYILGGGESDYLKINVDKDNFISTVLYSSEDPG